jgi:hypothetical protein
MVIAGKSIIRLVKESLHWSKGVCACTIRLSDHNMTQLPAITEKVDRCFSIDGLRNPPGQTHVKTIECFY